jgi:ABC-2 type transport system ATP-binding protein
VLAAGSPAELTASGQRDEIRFGAAAGLDVAALGAAVGASVVEVAPGEYRVDTEPTPAAIAALTGWLAERDLALGDLRAGRQRLEDVFLRLTESAAEAEAATSTEPSQPVVGAGPRGRGRASGGRSRRRGPGRAGR